jgi:hypothetical protein
MFQFRVLSFEWRSMAVSLPPKNEGGIHINIFIGSGKTDWSQLALILSNFAFGLLMAIVA